MYVLSLPPNINYTIIASQKNKKDFLLHIMIILVHSILQATKFKGKCMNVQIKMRIQQMEKDMSSDILTEELETVIYYLYVCWQKFV